MSAPEAGGHPAPDASAEVRRLAADAVGVLAAADARDEALAEFVPERRVLGIPRAARMSPRGRAWRLGVLLLSREGELLATGRVVRAEPPARRSVTANAVAEQRAYRAAAVRGGFADGETVDFDASPIDLDELVRTGTAGPLVVRDGGVQVRWSPAQPEALTPLAAYLADRVDLLAHPPQGA